MWPAGVEPEETSTVTLTVRLISIGVWGVKGYPVGSYGGEEIDGVDDDERALERVDARRVDGER